MLPVTVNSSSEMPLKYLIFLLFFANVNCGNLEIDLVKELFENYNKNTRPVHKASKFSYIACCISEGKRPSI